MTSIFIGGKRGTQRTTPRKDTFTGSSSPMSGIFTREKPSNTEKGKPRKDPVIGSSGEEGDIWAGYERVNRILMDRERGGWQGTLPGERDKPGGPVTSTASVHLFQKL